jgi:hypothetical protein
MGAGQVQQTLTLLCELSALPQFTIGVKAMAASSDISAFRASGHSVASTASHFGISERAVYKSCQAHAARLRRGVGRVASSSSARLVAAGGAMFGDLADDVAHDNTYWRCPVTHELLPVVPGSRRLQWMSERESLHARLRVPPVVPVEVPLPEPTPEPVFVALECDIEPIEPAAPAAVLPVVPRHNQRLPVVDVPSIDWSWLSTWMAEYWRVPLALAVAVLLIIASW